MWLEKDPNNPNRCKVTPWVSGYSVYGQNDYKRCVCDSWAPNDPNCITVSEECTEEPSEPPIEPEVPPVDPEEPENTPEEPEDNPVDPTPGIWENHDWIVDY
jgi:hypothetical protein